MPESVIKRLNELALADGRVKGKGEIAKLATNFEQDSDARNSLPETMETVVNNGVDPSVSLMDTNHDQELVYDEVVEPTGSESVEQQDEQQDEQHV